MLFFKENEDSCIFIYGEFREVWESLRPTTKFEQIICEVFSCNDDKEKRKFESYSIYATSPKWGNHLHILIDV